MIPRCGLASRASERRVEREVEWVGRRRHPGIVPVVDSVLKKLDVPVTALFSTLGRTAARGIETVAVGQQTQKWVGDLIANLKGGDTQTYQSWEMPDTGMGVGLNDVPRGSLGHWMEIEGGKIKNYQYVVPVSYTHLTLPTTSP